MSVQRRTDIDWLRGLAVVIMIEAHVFDSWTRADVRGSPAYFWAMVLAGCAAPAFLFLAGVSTVLATNARRLQPGGEAAAARTVRRRGWQILGLAFLFRAQALSLDLDTYVANLLKVDILNIMGPAIVLSGAVLGAVRDRWRRIAALGAMAAGFTFLAPIVRVSPWLAWLPDPIEGYLRPQLGVSTFAFFPWAGFLFAGGAVALFIEHGKSDEADRRIHVALLSGGAALAAAAYGAAYLPSIYAESRFWTTSPTFFFLRLGVLAMAVGLARFGALRWPPAAPGRVDALARFGRSSLFVYWIHVVLVYGWPTAPLHKALSLAQVSAAFAAVTAMMFVLVLVKQRVREWRRPSPSGPTAAPAT